MAGRGAVLSDRLHVGHRGDAAARDVAGNRRGQRVRRHQRAPRQAGGL